ncbi:hypothetical protein PAI11_09180 [Patulibacter medicamentivorans]|uniref:Uncharacterized protein n=1 Tax=Patulibacter medicamentivorans TaxID=1097667 RepID=H0E2A5_9ACTN|nr:hypothetical protein PAI11_09180 [Patulibacter medicamentivorans]
MSLVVRRLGAACLVGPGRGRSGPAGAGARVVDGDPGSGRADRREPTECPMG